MRGLSGLFLRDRLFSVSSGQGVGKGGLCRNVHEDLSSRMNRDVISAAAAGGIVLSVARKREFSAEKGYAENRFGVSERMS